MPACLCACVPACLCAHDVLCTCLRRAPALRCRRHAGAEARAGTQARDARDAHRHATHAGAVVVAVAVAEEAEGEDGRDEADARYDADGGEPRQHRHRPQAAHGQHGLCFVVHHARTDGALG